MTRAGYAGEDTPRAMFPTSFGYIDTVPEDVTMSEQGQDVTPPVSKRQYFIGDNKVNKFKANMEVKNPMQDGLGELTLLMKKLFFFSNLLC